MLCTVKLYPQDGLWEWSLCSKVLSATLCLGSVVSQLLFGESRATQIGALLFTVLWCIVSLLPNRLPPLPVVFGLPVAFHESGGSPTKDTRVPLHDIASYILSLFNTLY